MRTGTKLRSAWRTGSVSAERAAAGRQAPTRPAPGRRTAESCRPPSPTPASMASLSRPCCRAEQDAASRSSRRSTRRGAVYDEQELPVAVEDAEAPRRRRRAGRRRETGCARGGSSARASAPVKPGAIDVHQQRRGEHAEQDEHRHRERQQREQGPRHLRGRVVLAPRAQPGMDRDERARQRALRRTGSAADWGCGRRR